MEVDVTGHARERMRKYDVSVALLEDALQNPDSVVNGYGGRRIYQKKLNHHVLRVVIEESNGLKKAVTVYKARGGRYGI